MAGFLSDISGLKSYTEVKSSTLLRLAAPIGCDIKALKDQPLEEFARRIFSRLGVAHFEERESSNYVGGHYFRSIALGIEVVIAFADSKGLEEYRFCVALTAEQSAGYDTSYLQNHAQTLARLLSAHSWRCFVPDDATTVAGDAEGTIYNAQ